MKILILRVSSIGDVIHTLPAIFFIKKCYPNAKISWVVQKKAADLIVNQPFLENIFVLEDKFLHPKNILCTIKTVKKLRATRWDAILDFQGLPKTSILSCFLSGVKFGFAAPHARSWIATLFTNVNVTPNYKNIIQKNLCLASEFLQQLYPVNESPAIDQLKKDFTLDVSVQDKQKIEIWLETNKIKNFILLCPNTTWQTKHWPEEYWFEFIKLFVGTRPQYDLLLIGQNFGNAAHNIASKIKSCNVPVKIVPDINLCQAAYLISKASLVIAPDTGLLHLADFLNIKSIGIFGPTSKDLLGAFLNKENKKNAVQVYRPEHWNLKKTTKSYNQMYKLSPRVVLEKVLDILNIKYQ